MIEWISVDDRLPGFGEEVLIVVEAEGLRRYVTEATWAKTGGVLYPKQGKFKKYMNTYLEHSLPATHWAHMPELPKA